MDHVRIQKFLIRRLNRSILRLLAVGLALGVSLRTIVAIFRRRAGVSIGTFTAVLYGQPCLKSRLTLLLIQLFCGQKPNLRELPSRSPVLTKAQGGTFKKVAASLKPEDLWEWFRDMSPLLHNLRDLLGTPQVKMQFSKFFKQLCAAASSESREIDHRDLQNFSTAIQGWIKIRALQKRRIPLAPIADEEFSWLESNFSVLFPGSSIDQDDFSKWAECVILHRFGVTLLDALQKAKFTGRFYALRLGLKLEVAFHLEVKRVDADEDEDPLIRLHTNTLAEGEEAELEEAFRENDELMAKIAEAEEQTKLLREELKMLIQARAEAEEAQGEAAQEVASLAQQRTRLMQESRMQAQMRSEEFGKMQDMMMKKVARDGQREKDRMREEKRKYWANEEVQW